MTEEGIFDQSVIYLGSLIHNSSKINDLEGL